MSMYFPFRLITWGLIILVLLIVFGIAYLKNAARSNKAERIADKLDKKPELSRQLSEKLNVLFAEIDCDINHVKIKLNLLKYSIDINYHKIHRCFPMEYDTFLFITTYEFFDVTKIEAVEEIMNFNYKFIIDTTSGRIAIYTDPNLKEKHITIKKSFIKGFFAKYLELPVEI